ncbi:P-loop NTPase family protein [Arthrobacter sp. TMN-50]
MTSTVDPVSLTISEPLAAATEESLGELANKPNVARTVGVAKKVHDTGTDCAMPVDAERLQQAKRAYTTRFLSASLDEDASGYLLRQDAPHPGDIVLARVVELGSHLKLESPVSRRQTIFVGDEILVAYGNRYAPDQFLAEVPGDLDQCQLVAGGGVAGKVLEQHAGMKEATTIQPIGLLATTEGVLNLRHFAPADGPTAPAGARKPTVVAVLGTSMNSGKSTTLACLVNGLTSAGLSVSAGKATGTGSGNDPRLFTDAGARLVLDFTDFGYPTTFRLQYTEVRNLLVRLIARLSREETDVIVVEIADGVYQGETARLLADPIFHGLVDHVLFSAADALGASAGVQVLRESGVEVAAVSGLLTASPMATAEATAVLEIPVINTFDLCQAEVARRIVPMTQPVVAQAS